MAGHGPQRPAADRGVGVGVDGDADHRPGRRGDAELSVLPVRQPGAGRLRLGDRGAGDLAAPPAGQPGRATGHLAVRAGRRARRRPRGGRRAAGAAVRRYPQFACAPPGLRQQPGPADHQRVRRDAVRAGPGHSGGRRGGRAAGPSAPGPSRRPPARGAGERGGADDAYPGEPGRRAVGRGDHPDRHRRPRRGPRAAHHRDPPLAGSPRIFRGDDSGTRQIPVPKPQIYRPPQQ